MGDMDVNSNKVSEFRLLDRNNDGIINKQDYNIVLKEGGDVSIYNKLAELGDYNIDQGVYDAAKDGTQNIDEVINNLKQQNVSKMQKLSFGIEAENAVGIKSNEDIDVEQYSGDMTLCTLPAIEKFKQKWNAEKEKANASGDTDGCRDKFNLEKQELLGVNEKYLLQYTNVKNSIVHNIEQEQIDFEKKKQKYPENYINEEMVIGYNKFMAELDKELKRMNATIASLSDYKELLTAISFDDL